jgi:hypothetical protein
VLEAYSLHDWLVFTSGYGELMASMPCRVEGVLSRQTPHATFDLVWQGYPTYMAGARLLDSMGIMQGGTARKAHWKRYQCVQHRLVVQ